jgi:drug/metabolite transporter (DMT)-like permease
MSGSSTKQLSTNISPTTWGQLLLLGVLWGGSFFFARIAVAEIPPLWLVFLRVSIAALALHLYLLARGDWLSFKAAPFLPFIVLGLVNNAIPFSLIFTGQTQIGAGLASILNATTPFLTVLVAHYLTKDEKANAQKIIGTLLGILGAIIIVNPFDTGKLSAPLWAYLAVIGAALSYSFAAIYAKRFKGTSPIFIATGQLSGSTLLMLPIAFSVHGTPTIANWHLNSWLAVLALALVSTAFAYTLFFRILNSAGATVTSLVTLLVPISAVLLGTIFLKERLTTHEIGGMVMIFVGLLIINGSSIFKKAKPLN